MMEKLLIVGAGATGCLTANLLRKICPEIAVTMCEKSKGVGGRMTTQRNPSDHAHHIDMGAQYITRFEKDSPSNDLEQYKTEAFRELFNDGILIPFQGTIDGEGSRQPSTTKGSQHYVSPAGMNAIPKYFLQKSQAQAEFQQQIQSIDISSNEIAVSYSEGETKTFNSIVLTCPVPQLLNLEGNFLSFVEPSVLSKLRDVSYSSRYALGLFFTEATPKTSWTAKYFENPIVCYACWDTRKYSNNESEISTLLVHSSVPFGLDHLEQDKEKVKDILMSAVADEIPHLPSPSHTHLIRWRYSQVYHGYMDAPGHVTLNENPLVLITGDAFTHSNLEGCMEAAYSTANRIKTFYSSQ